MNITRVGTLSVGLFVGATLAGGLFGPRALAGGSGKLGDDLRRYTAILSAIQDEYVDEIGSDRLVASSIREMLRSLDPHSNFLDTREYSSQQERQKGSYSGLGIQVQSIDGNITVIAPFEGTPAHRLGLRAGDVISRIEGEDARGWVIDEAVKRLRGPRGTAVRITVVREGYPTPLEFTVLRAEIPLHSVPYFFMVGERTGYVRLTDFNETTACRTGDAPGCENELERALKSLHDDGASSLILDLRDNPGGLLEQAIAVSNLFLKRGQLVVFTRGRTRRDEANFVTDRDSPFAETPLVVLTSRHTASASEIVAGALQDHDRAVIVGETTFGKGLVQTVMQLRNVRGYALSMTTARYYTPSGRSIQRDYGSTALEDYYAGPKDRPTCAQGPGESKLTDAGRKVLGGDGIAPDYCVEPEKPGKFVSYLIGRQAFVGFSRGFASAASSAQGDVAGAGSRPDVSSAKVRLIRDDFDVTPETLRDFRAFLVERRLKFTDAELDESRELIGRLILEEVLRQAFGEGVARRRTLAWDLQFQRGLAAIPAAGQLLRDPQGFASVRAAAARTESAARP